MPRRIEVELTSRRDDGSWTWRAPGAKQPRGELDGGLLPSGASVGDVLRADADFTMDGIVITGVLPPKGRRAEPERLELLGPPRGREPGVTTSLVGRRGRDRGDRGPRDRDRPDRGDRRGQRDRRPDGRSGDRRGGRDGGRDRDRTGGRERRRTERPRPERASEPTRPRPKRLKAGRAHRKEAVQALPEEMRPLAEVVLRGGIPALRSEIDRQNELARADDKPLVSAGPLVALAERLLPRLRTAEWRDRADAALRASGELDLRDLRSVVVAADAAARDEASREVADQVRDLLARRVEAEHQAWLDELAGTLADGRVVRALRLSSRPPKAGAPLPADLSTRLATAVAGNLTADTAPDRYATVLDALALSPVRTQVVPEGIPATPGDSLLAVVRKLAPRLPQVAPLFGVDPAAKPTGDGRRPRPSPPAPSAAGGGPAPA